MPTDSIDLRTPRASSSHLDQYDLVVGARAPVTQASWSRRAGNGLLNAIAGYLAGHPIPDLTSGYRAARRELLLEFIHLLPNGFSTPTTTTMAFLKAGYSVRFEPIEARERTGASKIRLGPDGVRFFLILLKVITIFSPLRIFVPISLAAFALGAGYALWTIGDAVARHQLLGAAHYAERRDLPDRSGVGADLDAAFRRALRRAHPAAEEPHS